MLLRGRPRFVPLRSLILAACLLAGAALARVEDVPDFRILEKKPFLQPIPEVPLSEAEVRALKARQPVSVLLPSQDGLKASYLRVILPFDPVTAWWIIQDIEHFHLTDPAYPATGPLGEKRRSFMPYVADGAVCRSEGHLYLYQLLALPLVQPRVYSLDRHPSRAGFPWESAWSIAPTLVCSENRNPEVEHLFREAVRATRNNGCWHVGPVPESLRARPEDALLAYVEYFVDANPGGNLAALAPIVNQVTETGLPALCRNLLLHGRTWEAHLAKYHTPDEVLRYRQEVEAFRRAMGF